MTPVFTWDVPPDLLWRGTALHPGNASSKWSSGAHVPLCRALRTQKPNRDLRCAKGHQPHISGCVGMLTNALTIRPYSGTKTESFDIYLTVAPPTEQVNYPITSMMGFFVGFLFRRDVYSLLHCLQHSVLQEYPSPSALMQPQVRGKSKNQ